jgi:hypothetical protein
LTCNQSTAHNHMADDPSPECLPPAAVKRTLLAALAAGEIRFAGHALTEMENDKITQDEALAVLRGGVVEPGELERGCWRYRVRATRTCVVVALRSQTAAVVVTAWRVRR